MAEAGKVPVRESVGAALRVYRANVPTIMVIALAASVLGTLLAVLANSVPQIGILLAVANWAVTAFAYAALLALSWPDAGSPWQAASKRWAHLLGAMLLFIFFLCIVGVVLFLVAIAILSAVSMNYAPQIEAAQNDPAAMERIAQQIVAENPAAIVVMFPLFIIPLLWLSSRFYLIAPATFDAVRVRVFETWPWTRGSALRIIGARFLLLFPAAILGSALSILIAAGAGADAGDPAAFMAFAYGNPIGLFIMNFFQFALIYALEAPLSAYLYRGLKPVDAPPAPM